ncbi:uncharacterized protein LOC103313285 isoform X1 [Tribolium castaneum]|uniref:Uncharacterized protein n=1 Tax=Tribolium castaneum TaxID=7070 RepID=A0A139WPR8_TRICA|nr:PREDICTED: uncharacterized protein LOC103313285 isoform X1 [Tribolium castaneum]KYB29917.1 hypothetical protein TcasGA2_TC031821 [Tribolium castaneum]|eukprot:XP_008194456.1 PREDICTED: uncharacterized protein LOC103313285 isoform X1 [Tribolium castaneum]
MAVPFVLPEDEINNLIVAVIFILSQTRLQRNEENRELQECMEELVRLLAEELQRRSRSSEYDNQLKQTLLLLRQSLSHFTPTLSRIQRRSNFESCCDDCKISLHEDCATKDCSQVGLILRKIDDDETSAIFKEGVEEEKEGFVEESLLSRLVPRVRTFWKAVPLICVVGLHLFQISYSM